MSEEITPEVERIAEGMDRLVWFIDFELFAAGSDMTLRQAHERIRVKEKELGVPWSVVELHRDHPLIWSMIEQIGMAEDNKEIIVSERHMDLPVGFQFKEEYRAMLDEEVAWEDAHPGATTEEHDAALEAIVAKHVSRINSA